MPLYKEVNKYNMVIVYSGMNRCYKKTTYKRATTRAKIFLHK